MIRQLKNVFSVVFVVLGFFTSMHALDVVLTQDIDATVLQKKIEIHFNLDPQDQGILKSSLQFSIDIPDITLSSWQSIEQPMMAYIPAFKKTKKMFTDSFNGVLSLDCGDRSIDERKDLLADATVYVVGLVAEKDGKIQPFVVGKPIKQQSQSARVPAQTVVDNSTTIEQRADDTVFVDKPVPDLEQEYVPVDKLSQSWNCLVTWIKGVFSWRLIMILTLLFMLILAFFIGKRRIDRLKEFFVMNDEWEREITYFIIFMLVSGLLYFLRGVIGAVGALILFAAMCFGGMLRASLVPPFEESFLGRLKDLIGLILGALIVPVLFKAYLLHCGL